MFAASCDRSYHEFSAVLGLCFLLLFAEGGLSTVPNLRKKKIVVEVAAFFLVFNTRMLHGHT